MRHVSIFLGLLILLSALPVTADENGSHPTATAMCSPVGTWIGGSDAATPYMMTVAPAPGGRYTALFQLAVPASFPPYLGISVWSGEMVRVEPGKYDVWVVLLAVWDPVWASENGVNPDLPELHAVHSVVEFTDCNTIKNVIDLYDGYLNFDFTKGMVPFVTPPDWSVLTDGATMDETYYRVPMAGAHATGASDRLREVGTSIDRRRLLRR